MTGYLIRRTAVLCGLLLFASVLVFALMEVLPGDPAEIVLTHRQGGEPPSAAAVESLRKSWGLDRPTLTRFLDWMGGAVRGDFGISYATSDPVSSDLFESIGRTLVLALAAGLLVILLSLPWGLSAAARAGGWWDRLSLLLAAVLAATPVFVLGLVLVLVFALVLGVLPAAGNDTLAHYVLPALTLGLVGTAMPARVLRRSLVDELEKSYITAARARGAGRDRVLNAHALRNALLPWTTLVGLAFRGFLGGSVLVEAVFAFRGLGTYLVESVAQRDLPAVQASILVFVAVTVTVNFVTDVACAALDPRLRLKGGAA